MMPRVLREMKKEDIDGLLGTTAGANQQCSAPIANPDDWTPEQLAEIERVYKDWHSNRLRTRLTALIARWRAEAATMTWEDSDIRDTLADELEAEVQAASSATSAVQDGQTRSER